MYNECLIDEVSYQWDLKWNNQKKKNKRSVKMRKELTEIDKTVRKIKRLLDFHRKQNENLELDEKERKNE